MELYLVENNRHHNHQYVLTVMKLSPAGHQDSGGVFRMFPELSRIQGSPFVPENHSRRRHRPQFSGRGEETD